MKTWTQLMAAGFILSALMLFSERAEGLDHSQPPEGFEAIFTGKDLDGWDGGEVKPPRVFKRMSYQQWYDYRKRMADGVSKHWRIQNGELIGRAGAPDLVTWKQFGDFEMWVDWKLSKGSAGAVALRYGPQIKLLDPRMKGDKSGRAVKGSGGLWTNTSQAMIPTQCADKPVGEWNRMHIQIVGPYVTVVLNGVRVVNHSILENIFDRKRPVDMKGPIHLQAHAGEVCYRNIFIRPLSSEQSNKRLAQIAGDDDKYAPLFNGKDLSGWAGALKGYEVVEGSLRCKRKDGGNIQTIKQYSDFVVRLEFKLPPASNNGLLIRTPNTKPTHTRDTLELQILDNHHAMHQQLAPSQYHGSAYGIAPAFRGYLRPVGQWNYQEVYVEGDHIKVFLNGYPILDTYLKKVAPNHPAASAKRGHFGLSGYSDPVAFRRIRLKELK